MGMHDSITVRHPACRPGCYQSKDLECGLDEYELREDGTLVSVYQFTTDGREEILFTETGEVRFYGDFDGVWVEYSAYFSKGKLLHIEQTSPPNPAVTGSPVRGVVGLSEDKL